MLFPEREDASGGDRQSAGHQRAADIARPDRTTRPFAQEPAMTVTSIAHASPEAVAARQSSSQPHRLPRTMSLPYFLPALPSRFPLRINPHYSEDSDRAANAWALAQFGAGSSEVPAPLRLDNFTIWAALAYPTVDAATLTDWCRFNALYTNVENRLETVLDSEHEAQATGCWDLIVRALYRMAVSDNPWTIAREASSRSEVQQCLLMAARLSERMARRKARHFLHCLARMVHAQRDEYSVLASANMDIHDYIEFRTANYGIPLFIAAANGMLVQEPTTAEWNDPARAQLELLVARQCCLVNDLYSFEKEHRERGERRPLVQAVTVLMEGEGLRVQAAVDRLIGIIQCCEDEYVRIRDQMLARPTVSVGFREYCGRLEDIMAGNLRYMLISPRYFGADFTGQFEGGMRSISVPVPVELLRRRATLAVAA